MDWGLGTWHSHHFLLRDQLYFLPTTYYAAIVINFVMRLGWAFVISDQQPYIQQHFILLLGMYMHVYILYIWDISMVISFLTFICILCIGTIVINYR